MAKVTLNDVMQMEVKNISACQREYSFKVAADAMKSETDKVVSYIAGMVQLPGFRAGKAPANIVRTKYTAEINDEIRNRLVGAAIAKVEADKDLDILSLNFKSAPELKDGADAEFVFDVNIAPVIELGNYKEFKSEAKAEEVTDAMVDEKVDMYRTMWGGYADSEAPAKAEDMLKVSYTSDFTPAEDASASLKRQVAATDTFIWMSEPEMIPGCIAALTGAEKGKEYEFAANYPADYREEALAGKTVNYKVTVSAVQSRSKLNDEQLVEKVKAPSMDDFKSTLRKAMEQENNAKRIETAQDELFNKLSDAAGDFELPPALLDGEVSKELQKMTQNIRTQEDAEKFKAEIEDHKKEATENAKKALRRSLILRALAKAENTVISDEEVAYQMESMSRYYGYNAKEMRAMLDKNGAMEELRQDMANAKTLYSLAEAALK